MFKRLIPLFLCIISMAAFAGTDARTIEASGWDKLTDVQRTELLSNVARQAEQNAKAGTPAVPNAQAVDEWVTVGEHVGKMMGGAAKEIGVAVNDFVKTPVGMMAMAMVLWKYLGAAATHIAAGLLIWAVGFTITWRILRRSSPVTITYDQEKLNWRGQHPKLSEERTPPADDAVSTFYICSLIVLIVGIATIFSY